jgi:hypothetical protein
MFGELLLQARQLKENTLFLRVHSTAASNIHGLGKYSWSDGRIYDGEWSQNKM